MEMLTEMMERVLSGEVDFANLERSAWEESLKVGRETVERLLRVIDNALFENKPDGLKVVGMRKRKLVTLLGEIIINRRYYRDADGEGCFLLDELLSLEERKRLSPQVCEAASITCAHLTYRASAEIIGFMLPDGISHSALARFIRILGSEYGAEQDEGADALFSCGELPTSDGRQAETLYAELDAKMINLQREKNKKGELKLAITHEGWDARGDGEYSLREKRVHMAVSSSDEFACTHVYDTATHWDITRTKNFVVGGDGAPMAKKAAELAPHSLFQLDRFHLKRAIMRAFSGDAVLVPRVYGLATSGELTEALKLINERIGLVPPDKQQELRKLIGYLVSNSEGLVDYRERMDGPNEEARGLGAIEGNIDKKAANRFGKRGMRWTKEGANALAKVIELKANGSLSERVRRKCNKRDVLDNQQILSIAEKTRHRLKEDPEAWLVAHMPALDGIDSDKPWVKVLRGIGRIEEAV